MFTRLLTAATIVALAACSGYSPPTSPGGGGGSNGGDMGGGGTGGGGSTGGDTGGDPPASAAAVAIGNDLFKSVRNGTVNPAVDTVAAGGTVTWTWTNTGSEPHSVQSLGTPTFTSSTIMAGNGSTYSVVFTQPGTYGYDCAVHGTAMSGRIVVR